MCLSVQIPCNQSAYVRWFFLPYGNELQEAGCKLSVATGELCFSSFVKKSALKWNISSQTFIQAISSAHLLWLSEMAICTSTPVFFWLWKESGGMPACTALRRKSDACWSVLGLKLLIRFNYFNCCCPVSWWVFFVIVLVFCDLFLRHCICSWHTCLASCTWGTEPYCPADVLGSDWLFELGAEVLCKYNKELCGQEEGCFLRSYSSQIVVLRKLLHLLFLCHINTLRATLIM